MGNQPTSLIDTPPNKSPTSSPIPPPPAKQRPLPPPPPPAAHKIIKPIGLVKRLSLSKLHLSGKKKKKSKYYSLPADAERPSSPSCPEVFQDQDKYFILRWDPPAYDGGIPILGYMIQHLELGLPQLDPNDQDDTDAWYSSEPGVITQTEVILNNLVPGTTYQFRVLAENLMGYSPPSEVSEPIVFNPHGELDDWFHAPMFTLLLDDCYTAMEHEMLTLNVEVRGQPYPIVKWYDKHDVELTKWDSSHNSSNSNRVKVRSSGNSRTLAINGVELSDAGAIKCVAYNQEGTVECSTYVYVEAPPRIKRVHNPEFLQNPYDINEKEEERLTTFSDDDYEDLIFQAGELVRLKFMFSGSPKPDIFIYHDNEQVRNDTRIGTEFTDKVITIRIENIQRCDRGEWLVKLENNLGEDCSSVLITITDHPLPPGKPDILQLSDNSCILRWDEPTDDGGCPIHNYIVEYFRSEWGVWLKALTSKKQGAKIKDLIPGSKYRFRIKSENLYGLSEPSEESVEILITDAASSRKDEIMMPSVEESVEDEAMEILSHSDFERELEEDEEEQQHQQAMLRIPVPELPPRKKTPVPVPSPRRSPAPQIQIPTSAADADQKTLYSRGDLIRSAATSAVDYVSRFLSETGKPVTPTSPEGEEFEIDFDKLQKEYEDEIAALRDTLEGSDDEFDDEEEEVSDEDELFKDNKKPEEDEDDVFVKEFGSQGRLNVPQITSSRSFEEGAVQFVPDELSEESALPPTLPPRRFESGGSFEDTLSVSPKRLSPGQLSPSHRLSPSSSKQDVDGGALRLSPNRLALPGSSIDDSNLLSPSSPRMSPRPSVVDIYQDMACQRPLTPRPSVGDLTQDISPKRSPSPEEESEPEEEWPPRRRIFRSEEKAPPPRLNDKFKDYLNMKALNRGSSLRSLSSDRGSRQMRTPSMENMQHILDFDSKEEVNLADLRKAIILQEKREEEERLQRERQKEADHLLALAKEAELEERRKANRRAIMNMEEPPAEPSEVEKALALSLKLRNIGGNIGGIRGNPELLSKIYLGLALVLMVPTYWYYDVYFMLISFAALLALLLLWNKYRLSNKSVPE